MSTTHWHDDMIRRMHRLLDRALPADEEARLRAHLRECPACRTYWQTLQARSAATKEAGLRLPEEAKLRLYQRLNAERVRRGEPLLRVSAALLEAVRVRWQTARAEAPHVAREAARAGRTVAESAQDVARAASRGARETAASVGRAAQDCIEGPKELADAALSTGRDLMQTGSEAVQVVHDVAEKPRKIFLAPFSLSAKAAKAGLQAAKGMTTLLSRGTRWTIRAVAHRADIPLKAAKGGAEASRAAARGVGRSAQATGQAARRAGQAAKRVLKPDDDPGAPS